MTQQEKTPFQVANEKVHPVEEQWHYPILTKYGFVPREKTGVGFVRSYNYEHPSGVVIRCTTGSSADYWSHEGKPGTDYWMALEPYLQKLNLS